jgi:hypothetical protein
LSFAATPENNHRDRAVERRTKLVQHVTYRGAHIGETALLVI